MEYITTKEASAKWGISTTRITLLANEGRIPGAQRLGRSWLIPFNATKPPELKPDRSGSNRKHPDTFSFPLYHWRPDWSSTKEAQLSEQQRSLLLAENAIMECRFTDAYTLLQSVLLAPEDKATEIGCLWYAVLCCISMNDPDEYSKKLLRLGLILTEDFPHRDDFTILMDLLKTYVDPISYAANNVDFNTDTHYQCLPLMCLKIGYMCLTREAIKPNSADTALLELNLSFLKNTSSVIAVEMLHIYLLGIYYLRHDKEAAKQHAQAVVKMAFENKLYLPLVTYYGFFTPVLSPILAQYPKDFQEHCLQLALQYDKNFAAFLTAINKRYVIPKLDDADYPYVFSILMGQSNAQIAAKLGLHQQTIQGRFAKLCKKLGLKSKRDLKNYLLNYM